MWPPAVRLGALVLAVALPVRGAVDDVPFWEKYNDGDYLRQFGTDTFEKEAVSGFRVGWWDDTVTPCPGPDQAGFIGVVCGEPAPSGVRFVTAIDLSRGALPPSVARLKGEFLDPPFIVGLRFLTSLNFSGQLLSGTLPATFSYAPRLARLDLQGNNLTGAIPAELCSLPLTSPGGCINLAYNNFSGPLPRCFNATPCVDFEGNPRLERLKAADGTYLDCNPMSTVPSCWPQLLVVQAPPPPPQPAGAVALPVWAIVVIVLGSLLLAAGVAAAVVVCWRRWRQMNVVKERRQLIESIESELTARRFGAVRRFLVEELSQGCEGFSDDHFVGEGSFSRVYKGTLADGTLVAVKRLKTEYAKPGVELGFIREVEIISRASHRNLAQCVGFCIDTSSSVTGPPQLMLALRFYANGSVASRTRGREGSPLEWSTRKHIARGAAEGISYLHGGCNPPIVHRDIKAENILLDEKNDAIVSDFGLAVEMGSEEATHAMSIQGTLGHIAPEYFMSGKCTVKTDVYAFGVFLLELISGKGVFTLTRSVSEEKEEAVLHDWLQVLVDSARVAEVVDPEMGSSLQLEEVTSMLRVAALCVSCDPAGRPTMDQVSSMLLGGPGLAIEPEWKGGEGEKAGEELLRDLSSAQVWDSLSTGVTLLPNTLRGVGR